MMSATGMILHFNAYFLRAVGANQFFIYLEPQ